MANFNYLFIFLFYAFARLNSFKSDRVPCEVHVTLPISTLQSYVVQCEQFFGSAFIQGRFPRQGRLARFCIYVENGRPSYVASKQLERNRLWRGSTAERQHTHKWRL